MVHHNERTDLDRLRQIIEGRRSVRHYRADSVPEDLIARVLDMALWAPSGWGRQGCSFVVVQGSVRKSLQELFCDALGEVRPILENIYPREKGYVDKLMDFFSTYGSAPVLVLAYAGRLPNGEDDVLTAAVALQNFFLAAHAAGLGSTWTDVMRVREEEINSIVDVRNQKLVCIAPLGYPDEQPKPAPRGKGRVSWIGF
ncbi:nitroreductase family protein [Streptomyces sp. NPDC093595]|uniref:nitroreductase family protein n=1 Tax=Streptomyces sp. NPDC093595 TaxID=3366045 RepID=UPI0038084914